MWRCLRGEEWMMTDLSVESMQDMRKKKRKKNVFSKIKFSKKKIVFD